MNECRAVGNDPIPSEAKHQVDGRNYLDRLLFDLYNYLGD